jgi:hypothetical protein
VKFWIFVSLFCALWVGDAVQGEGEQSGTSGSASRPQPRTDANSKLAHEQLIQKAQRGRIDVYFVGDSITRRWGTTDPQYRLLLENWNTNFFGWNAANFGWGADRVENILWRLENGELEGVNPRVIVVLAGTNNVGPERGTADKVDDVTRGLRELVDLCRAKAPNAIVILTAIFPRNDKMAAMPRSNKSIGSWRRWRMAKPSATLISTTSWRTARAGCFQE